MSSMMNAFNALNLFKWFVKAVLFHVHVYARVHVNVHVRVDVHIMSAFMPMTLPVTVSTVCPCRYLCPCSFPCPSLCPCPCPWPCRAHVHGHVHVPLLAWVSMFCLMFIGMCVFCHAFLNRQRSTLLFLFVNLQYITAVFVDNVSNYFCLYNQQTTSKVFFAVNLNFQCLPCRTSEDFQHATPPSRECFGAAT